MSAALHGLDPCPPPTLDNAISVGEFRRRSRAWLTRSTATILANEPELTMLERALLLAGQGMHVVPLHHPVVTNDDPAAARCSCRDESCGKQTGKHPRTKNGLNDATTNEKQIREWWTKWPRANIGIACGPSGILVLDPDRRNGGDKTLANKVATLCALPPTPRSITGNGEHILFVLPKHLSMPGKFGPGLDVKKEGGYIVAAPSLHFSGHRYRWAEGCAIGEIPFAELPVPWSAAMYATAREEGERASTESAPPLSAEQWNGKGPWPAFPAFDDAPNAAYTQAERPDRARRILPTIEPAIEGANGHASALLAAEKLGKGMAIASFETVYALMLEWDRDHNVPRFGDGAELRRKTFEGIAKGHTIAWGKLLREKPPAKAAADTNRTTERRNPPKLGETLPASIERIKRRASGQEKPIALPWPEVNKHFGGGFWPGLHTVTASTGVGKTQFGFQVGLHAAKKGIPVLYLGFELGPLDVDVRALGLEAHVPWSHLWTGEAGPSYIDRVLAAVPTLSDLPFHREVARPHGFAPSEIRDAIEAMRAMYPETDGPGSRPILVIVDFLQLIGDEPGEEKDLRVRVGRAAYTLREISTNGSYAILCISSVSREATKLMPVLHKVAGLKWTLDDEGYPVNRRIDSPDAIVGLGKESGDIEYANDSVSVISKVPSTSEGAGVDVVFATAKGRATGAMWSPLHFTGYGYVECEDRGGRMVDAWEDEKRKGSEARQEKAKQKETESDSKKAKKETEKAAAKQRREQEARDKEARHDAAVVECLKKEDLNFTNLRTAVKARAHCGAELADTAIERCVQEGRIFKPRVSGELYSVHDPAAPHVAPKKSSLAF